MKTSPCLPQVLLNLQPRSFTAQCQATTWDEIKRSVVPPGVNISDGVMPPDLVNILTDNSGGGHFKALMAICSCRLKVACMRISHTCKGLKDAWIQPCQKITNIVVKQNLHGVLMVALKSLLTHAQ